MQDLVSFVQSHARGKREDLAGEVLALLLREEPGQVLLNSLIHGSNPHEIIEVVTQRASAGCVPDVHLIQQGKTIALLELKFWASLTSHQLSGRYFDVAPEVLFIVPEERVGHLQEELSALAANNRLSITSWRVLLDHLASSISGTDSREERLFASALEHLKEFCNVIEKEHFTPFTAEQLHSPVQDMRTEHLIWLTREILATAIQQQIVTEAGRLSAGFDTAFFYGQTVMLEGFRVWLGYWPQAWKHSPRCGPLWVQFYGREATALQSAGSFTDGIRAMGNELAFPILSASCGIGGTQEDEIANAITALLKLSSRLSILITNRQQTA